MENAFKRCIDDRAGCFIVTFDGRVFLEIWPKGDLAGKSPTILQIEADSEPWLSEATKSQSVERFSVDYLVPEGFKGDYCLTANINHFDKIITFTPGVISGRLAKKLGMLPDTEDFINAVKTRK